MTSGSRDSLAQALAAQEAKLVEIDRERADVRLQLERLRSDLVALDSAAAERVVAPPASDAASALTSSEKVALFRSLFRGRDDVYAKLWENTRTGKKGYAPACASEWVRGVCEKPRVKCGDCPNQAFVSVSDRTIIDHLQGRHVVGAYPLLRDETCWFLAVDFDKRSWMDDVAVFIETCRDVGVATAVERSRSGNGAHVWFFFSAPVAASIARKMGCYLITEAMARRHQLSMESYDRLFPSQDTMPRGGFGNLIALPLQHRARQQRNTLFLNDQFTPHADPDQWAYLVGVERIAPSTAERIAADATRKGLVLGVRAADLGDAAEDRSPWSRPPSGYAQRREIPGPLPQSVNAVLAQRIFVEKKALPSTLLNQIKRLAAFQNPEFYKKQSMRLSTALTPRVIACAEEFPEHVALPRGCLSSLDQLFVDTESLWWSMTSDGSASRLRYPSMGSSRRRSIRQCGRLLLRSPVTQLARDHDTGAHGLLTDRSDSCPDDSRGMFEEMGENVCIEEVALSGHALQVHRLGGGVLDLGELVL